jgi:hypothetical protein
MNLINEGSGGVSNIELYAYVDGSLATPAIIKASSNVTSLTDVGLGIRQVNCTALPSANYSAVASADETTTTNFITIVYSRSTTAIGVATGFNASTRFDADWSLIVTGA